MNKALLSGLLGGLVVALALSRPSHAEGPPKAVPIVVGAKPRVHAIVVGVSDYSDKQIKARPRAEKDANDLAKLLADKAYLGADVKLLLGKPGGGAEKATRANLLKALKTVVEDARPDDRVVFAFVGQGGPIGDSGDRRCYFLADSTFKGREKDAVAAEEIEEALKKLKAKNLAVFLDVDFTGFEADKAVAAPEPTLGKAPYKEFLGDDGSEDHLAKPGRIAFLATNGLTRSLDLKDNGIFMAVLLEALKGKADTQGYEADGLVTVDEVAKYMNKRLPELAREKGETQKQKEQEHFVIAGPLTHFVLTKNPEAYALAQKRIEKFDAMVRDKKLTDATQIEEGTAFLGADAATEEAAGTPQALPAVRRWQVDREGTRRETRRRHGVDEAASE